MSQIIYPFKAERFINLSTEKPDTLIITANLDPLRDEGEAYGKKLLKFNNKVKMYRVDSIHGFFASPINKKEINECYNYINEFLGDDVVENKMV